MTPDPKGYDKTSPIRRLEDLQAASRLERWEFKAYSFKHQRYSRFEQLIAKGVHYEFEQCLVQISKAL